MNFKLKNKVIGQDNSVFVIAEAGVNHNGDIKMAIRLIDEAVECGADAVKFQTFKTEMLVSKSAEKPEYQKRTVPNKSQYQMLCDLELTENEFTVISNYCNEKGILFLSTPYDQQSADMLVRLGVTVFKVSSADITNLPLLSYLAKYQLPIIISTGMSNIGEVEEAVNCIENENNYDIALLHCSFNYPTPYKDINLLAIKTLQNAFNYPVGYSDHSVGYEVAIASIGLGARIIEKHFTLDRTLPGPDHAASLEPVELKEFIKAIRNVEDALGDGRKRPVGGEIANRIISRRSIVATTDIDVGQVIENYMVALKRPGTGIEPKYLGIVVGSRARERIVVNSPLLWKQIEVNL